MILSVYWVKDYSFTHLNIKKRCESVDRHVHDLTKKPSCFRDSLETFVSTVSSRSPNQEILQQYEASLVCLPYPIAFQNIRKRMTVRAFVRDLKALSQSKFFLARCQTLHNVLAYVMEFEAVKQVLRGHTGASSKESNTVIQKPISNS